MNGLCLIDKDFMASSYEIIRKLKKYFNTSKVGHCGTLDPFATGLLIIGINQGTKVLPYLENDIKEYEAIIKLGKTTPSLDIETDIIKSKEIVDFTKKDLENVSNKFLGKIEQIPPIYSSIRVDGMHLYNYARNNMQVNIVPREVEIFALKLERIGHDEIKMYVKCSKGTYIRTLGKDIAASLNNLGYLISLRRLSIGSLNVKDAYKINEDKIRLYKIDELINFKKVKLTNSIDLITAYNGQLLTLNYDDDNLLILDDDEVIAIYNKINFHTYKCKRGLFDENTRYLRISELKK